jgi:hypothetical protein
LGVVFLQDDSLQQVVAEQYSDKGQYSAMFISVFLVVRELILVSLGVDPSVFWMHLFARDTDCEYFRYLQNIRPSSQFNIVISSTTKNVLARVKRAILRLVCVRSRHYLQKA